MEGLDTAAGAPPPASNVSPSPRLPVTKTYFILLEPDWAGSPRAPPTLPPLPLNFWQRQEAKAGLCDCRTAAAERTMRQEAYLMLGIAASGLDSSATATL